jgi:membrane-associated phospholipid phosphatase
MGKKRDAIKQVEQVDIAISKRAADVRDTTVVRAMGAFGQLGDQPPLIAFSLGVAIAGLLRRDPHVMRGGARMLAAHLLATGVKTLVKRSVDRTRPRLLVEEGRYEFGRGERHEGAYSSFPSGHTAGAVAVACAMAHDFPGSAISGYAAAAAIAAVQVPRCNHYVSDTAAGALIGLAAEAVVSSLFDRAGVRSAAALA